jgi:hypothetical protein
MTPDNPCYSRLFASHLRLAMEKAGIDAGEFGSILEIVGKREAADEKRAI